MLRILFLVGMWLLAGLMILPACAEKVTEEPVVKLPPREHTWVRKETVRKSRDNMFAKAEAPKPVIPVNESLMKRLNEPGSLDGASVSDAVSCLAAYKPLDQKRKSIQKKGGVWHAFERYPEVREFSNNGMQLDSTMNKLVASLGHLCKTAKGLPKDNISHVISGMMAEMGREGVEQKYRTLGEADEDVARWLEHAEYREKNQKRDLDYKLIGGLIAKTKPLLAFYEELTERQVDATSKDAFLSDSVTLLEKLKSLSTTDEYIVLALKEEKNTPYENFDPDM
jgi:hypothetical protein